ncbi:uncharacterized protein LOC124692325 isoform X2 [Lolium rigidum]|uniref:uncharacterized protein LOC124692325 isoform X2 n=1 Tax=Lolium rigidum TaxID=89674 RepID=UPI001F5C1281|nr:uncharacterized protein LOC124692325 isoform X2 [Lolium rigidum]
MVDWLVFSAPPLSGLSREPLASMPWLGLWLDGAAREDRPGAPRNFEYLFLDGSELAYGEASSSSCNEYQKFIQKMNPPRIMIYSTSYAIAIVDHVDNADK